MEDERKKPIKLGQPSAAHDAVRRAAEIATIGQRALERAGDSGLRDFTTRIASVGGLTDRLKGLSMKDALGASAFDSIHRIEAALSPMQKALEGDNFKRLQDQIASQKRLIDDFKTGIPEMPEMTSPPRDFHMREPIKLPPNPLHETNERLARIEGQFEKMEQIAAKSAEIATELQGHAGQFLEKFEAAATSNDCTARRAVWLAGAAVVVTVIMAVSQIVYNEVWRAPADAVAMQAAIAEIRAEVSQTRADQIAAIEQLAQRLETSDQEASKLLAAILAEMKTGGSDPRSQRAP